MEMKQFCNTCGFRKRWAARPLAHGEGGRKAHLGSMRGVVVLVPAAREGATVKQAIELVLKLTSVLSSPCRKSNNPGTVQLSPPFFESASHSFQATIIRVSAQLSPA